MIGEISGIKTEVNLCRIPGNKFNLKEVVSSVLQNKLLLKPTPQPKKGI
jgi:hypothetical protein